MCSTAINLTSRALNEVSNAEILLKIKGFIALFIQTMEVSRVPTHARRSTDVPTGLDWAETYSGVGILDFHARYVPPHALRQVRRTFKTPLQRRLSRGEPHYYAPAVSILIDKQIVSTDDYMPMAINSLEEYEKVINVSWFIQDQPTEELTYVSMIHCVASN